MGNSKKTGVVLLEELKVAYDNGQVSALVGSGFSKNVSTMFPLWSDLLLDAITELYSDEMESLVERQIVLGEPIDVAREKAVKVIIDRIGSLEIVSEYIRRKGYGHEAIDCYTKAVIFNPADKVIMLKIANIYKLLGSNDKALGFYDKIIEIDKDCTDAYFNKGLVFANDKKYTEAISCFEKVWFQ